jgi:hypothetical protein
MRKFVSSHKILVEKHEEIPIGRLADNIKIYFKKKQFNCMNWARIFSVSDSYEHDDEVSDSINMRVLLK